MGLTIDKIKFKENRINNKLTSDKSDGFYISYLLVSLTNYLEVVHG